MTGFVVKLQGGLHDVSVPRVSGAEVLNDDLGALPFGGPVHLERLGVCCEARTDFHPVDVVEDLTLGPEGADLIVDEVDLPIDVAIRHLSDGTHLLEWHAIDHHAIEKRVLVTALLASRCPADGKGLLAKLALISGVATSGLSEAAVLIRVHRQRFSQVLALRIPTSRCNRIDLLQILESVVFFENRLVVFQTVIGAASRASEKLFMLCTCNRASDSFWRSRRAAFRPLEGIWWNAEAHASWVPTEIDINALEWKRQSSFESEVCRRYLREVVQEDF